MDNCKSETAYAVRQLDAPDNLYTYLFFVMILITTAPLKFKAKKVLRLIHPDDVKNPLVNIEFQHTEASTTLVKVGQTIVDEALVNSVNAILLHSCSPALLKDYLHRLASWKDRLNRFKKSDRKYLVVYGNVMSILSDTILYLPQSDNVIINQMQKSPVIDVTTSGLGITQFWCITIINIKKLGANFKRNLSYLSRTRMIFLLESGTVIDNTGKVTYGNLYVIKDGKITHLKELPKPETPDDVEAIHERKIPPIKVTYAKEETVAETPDNTEVKET